MSQVFVVQYRTRPETAEENQKLVEAVFAELAVTGPAGLNYITLRLEDGVTFVHIAIHEERPETLTETPAFQEFVREIGSRVVAPPKVSTATIVGSFGYR